MVHLGHYITDTYIFTYLIKVIPCFSEWIPRNVFKSTYFLLIIHVKPNCFYPETTHKTMIQEIQDGIAQNYV